MKKVLLTSTALVMTAGVAAAEMSMSAGATLTYGNFGTGHSRAGDAAVNAAPSGAAVPDAAWTSEADLDIAGSGGGGTLSYSATLELDESGNAAGAFTVTSGGLTFVYDEDDIGGLVETGADGEDDNTGDYKVSYSVGGLSASYETDAVDNDAGETASEDTLITLGYTAGDLTIGLEMEENDNAVGGTTTATTTVGYVMGAATINLEADDADAWEASVAYANGATTMTVTTDSADVYSVALDYAAGDMTFSASQEFNEGEDTTFGISYAAGDMTFSAAYDSGNEGHYGDEAETLINASYAMDGATFAAKANDQDEIEVSMSFSF
jgi:outer membrane protein OmpU